MLLLAMPLLRGRAEASGAARGRGSSSLEAAIVVHARKKKAFPFFCVTSDSLSRPSSVLERVFFFFFFRLSPFKNSKKARDGTGALKKNLPCRLPH